MTYTVGDRILAVVRKQLPPPAMIEFVGAMNASAAAGGGYNDHLKAAWANVGERWERRPDRRWARRKITKMDPTLSDVHMPVPLGTDGPPKKKRRRLSDLDESETLLVKDAPKTLYVNRPLLNGDDIRAWAAEQGFESTLPADDMHATIAFSKEPVDWSQFEPQTDELRVEGGDREMKMFDPRTTENGATVLAFSSDDLQQRWQEFKDGGASWDFPEYQPHITITYQNAEGIDDIVPYDGPLIFGPEEFQEVRQDLAAAGNGGDKVEFPEDPVSKDISKAGARHSKADMEMLQQMHDHSVKLGASCPVNGGGDTKKSFDGDQLVRKLDDDQHMVWGWANVITVKGQPVVDEHKDIIEPDTMEKAATEFMKDVRTHAAMHRYDWVVKGDDLVHEPVQIGTVVHSLPLSYGLAKLLGVSTDVEGWIVGVHVTNESEWQKYKDGTYKSFSIGGRSEFHPLD
jgi:hypothetical protein